MKILNLGNDYTSLNIKEHANFSCIEYIYVPCDGNSVYCDKVRGGGDWCALVITPY